jgi:hypothetical protein
LGATRCDEGSARALKELNAIRKQVDALAEGYAAAFKMRKDIEELGRKLRAIMRKVAAAELKPNDHQRLADELLRPIRRSAVVC